jgi:hypothetical protein
MFPRAGDPASSSRRHSEAPGSILGAFSGVIGNRALPGMWFASIKFLFFTGMSVIEAPPGEIAPTALFGRIYSDRA